MARLARYRRDSGVSYAEGVFATLELLGARPREVDRVLLSSRGEANEGAAMIRALCAGAGIPVDVDDRTIERLTPRESHLALGVFRKYEMSLDPTADHAVLVTPADMGNLGTIARTMIAFGFGHLALIRPAVDAFDPKAVRASMGALFRVSFEYFDSFDAYRACHTRSTYPFMTDGDVTVDRVRFDTPCTLVFGNESSGLPEAFHEMGTSVVIPQTDAVDSLSLPVAVAVALYERARQRAGIVST
ncbi:MAG: TrmH family RNA methyltransferase [Candidatus Bipolaricaulia bacterium]